MTTHKQLFNELVGLAKSAAEKSAFGYGYSSGGYRGRGGMYGGGMYGGGMGGPYVTQGNRSGYYRGPHPAALPAMIRGQEQLLPEEQYRRGLLGEFATGDMSGTAEGKLHSQARSDYNPQNKELREAVDRYNTLRNSPETTYNALREAEQAMNADPAGLAAWRRQRGGFDAFLGNIDYRGWGKTAPTFDAWVAAQKAHENAKIEAPRNLSSYESDVERATGRLNQTGKSQTDLAQNQINTANKARGSAVPSARSGVPIGGTTNVQPLPQPSSLPPKSNPAGVGAVGANIAAKKLSSSRLAQTPFDQLIEGAARTMFDRYVKIANAKLVAELGQARGVK